MESTAKLRWKGFFLRVWLTNARDVGVLETIGVGGQWRKLYLISEIGAFWDERAGGWAEWLAGRDGRTVVIIVERKVRLTVCLRPDQFLGNYFQRGGKPL
jgi:hypothetical protein